MKISKRFGLILISPEKLVEEEIKNNPGLRIAIRKEVEVGKEIPEQLVIKLVSKRLNDTDVIARGWVLDGFPHSNE